MVGFRRRKALLSAASSGGVIVTVPFTGANADPINDGLWTVQPTIIGPAVLPRRLNNAAFGSLLGSTTSYAYYNPIGAPANGYVQVTVAGVASYVGCSYRLNAATGAAILFGSTPGTTFLQEWNGASFVAIASAARTANVGDILRLDVRGAVATGYVGGTPFLSGATSILTAGFAGITLNGSSDGVDDFIIGS